MEVRQYGPRIAAEATVEGDEESARPAGFRLVASYIFGANAARRAIAMTAPVAQRGAPGKIAMTAPVAQRQDTAVQWSIRFFMPAKHTMETLPVPDDFPRAARSRARRDGGGIPLFRRAERGGVQQAWELLGRRLDGSAWRTTGEPVAWFYDPASTRPPLRRNEVAVAVAPAT